jgi:hypothetical protein
LKFNVSVCTPDDGGFSLPFGRGAGIFGVAIDANNSLRNDV